MTTVLDFLEGRVPDKPDGSIVNATLVAEHAVSSSSSSSSDDDDDPLFLKFVANAKRRGGHVNCNTCMPRTVCSHIAQIRNCTQS